MIRRILAPAYRFLETPAGYELLQRVAAPTVAVNRSFLRDFVQPLLRRSHRLLDLGCGTGGYFEELRGASYVGIDINEACIGEAASRYPGEFRVMDATDLKFEPESFDHIVSVATTHHLSDGQLANMLSTTMRLLRPQGHLHIVDAVLPANRLNLLKEAWFRLDRGQYPRYREELESRLRACDEPRLVEVRRESPLHDIMYARLTRS